MDLTIKGAWPSPQRNTFKIPYEMAARQLAREKGVTLEYAAFKGSQEEFRALLKGDVHVAFASVPQIVTLVRSGVKVRLVLGFMERQPFRLVSRSSIRSVQDLKGKIISVLPDAGISEQAFRFTVSGLMLQEGKDYKLVTSLMVSPERLRALVSGAIHGTTMGLDMAYHLMAHYPSKFNILGEEALSKLSRMVVVGWITTEEVLRKHTKTIELFASYLGQAYTDVYNSDISVMAQICKQMPYLEDYSLETLEMSLKDYLRYQIWPRKGTVDEETWGSAMSELGKLGLVEKPIPFCHIAHHTLVG